MAHTEVTRWVVAVRRRTGFSRSVFAALAGLSTSYVGMIEAGEREPSLAVVRRIARCFPVLPLTIGSQGEGEP